MIEIIPLLPAEYQEVEYIQSSGTQYINSMFVPNQDTQVIIDIDILSPSPSVAGIFGARTAASNVVDSFAVFNVNGALRWDYNSSYQSSGVTTTGRHYIDANKNTASFDGTEVTLTYGSFSSTYPLFIFTINAVGSADSRMTHAKLYSCQIYDNGSLVRGLIPCYRKADNVAGMYDFVSGEFFTNEGTGTFAVGADSNIHTTIIVTAGGAILKKWALRRRTTAMSGNAPFAFEYTGDYTDNRDANGIGTIRFTSSGTLTVLSGKATVSAYILGAGGGAVHCVVYGDDNNGGTGGGGGQQTVEVELAEGSYEIVIGTGGSGKNAGGGNYSAGTGGNTSAFGYTSTGGSGATMEYFASPSGGTGGSPNGKAGKSITSANGTGGAPNGGDVVNGIPQAGDNGYVELTFS